MNSMRSFMGTEVSLMYSSVASVVSIRISRAFISSIWIAILEATVVKTESTDSFKEVSATFLVTIPKARFETTTIARIVARSFVFMLLKAIFLSTIQRPFKK